MTWSFFGGRKPSKRNKSLRQVANRRVNGSGTRLSRLELLEQRHLLAVLTVNTNSNPVAFGNTELSLREALTVVNAGTTAGFGLSAQELAQINTATALGANDTINFSGVVSPIVLGSELPIEKSLTIDGPGLSN